jgi:hypothetical protein
VKKSNSFEGEITMADINRYLPSWTESKSKVMVGQKRPGAEVKDRTRSCPMGTNISIENPRTTFNFFGVYLRPEEKRRFANLFSPATNTLKFIKEDAKRNWCLEK